MIPNLLLIAKALVALMALVALVALMALMALAAIVSLLALVALIGLVFFQIFEHLLRKCTLMRDLSALQQNVVGLSTTSISSSTSASS